VLLDGGVKGSYYIHLLWPCVSLLSLVPLIYTFIYSSPSSCLGLNTRLLLSPNNHSFYKLTKASLSTDWQHHWLGDRVALSGKGYEYISLMTPYDSYRSVGYSETKLDYDIMRETNTSMKYLSGGEHILILSLVMRQVQQMGHHVCISGNGSLQVKSPRAKQRRSSTTHW
jgi:hypothetical protein